MSAPSSTPPPPRYGGWREADVRRLARRPLTVRLSIAGGLAGGMLVSLLAYGAALVGQQPEDHPPSHGEFSLAAVLPLLESIAIIATLTTSALTACVLFVGLRARERVSAARHTLVASLLAGALQIPLLLGSLLLALPMLRAIDDVTGHAWSPWCRDAALQVVVPTFVFSVPVAAVFGLFYVAAVDGVRSTLETPSPRSIALARGIGRAPLLVACLLAELLAWAAPTSSVWLATQTVLVVVLLGADVLSDSPQRLRAVR